MKQVTFLLSGLALALGCSSGKSGPSIDDACTMFAQAQCAKLQSCSNAVVANATACRSCATTTASTRVRIPA
jgi:hypothetical protein